MSRRHTARETINHGKRVDSCGVGGVPRATTARLEAASRLEDAPWVSAACPRQRRYLVRAAVSLGRGTGYIMTGPVEDGGPGTGPDATAIANPELERALEHAASGVGRTGVYAALLDGSVLVPTVRRNGNSAGAPAVLTVPDTGEEILLGFSSYRTLQAWSSQFSTFAVMPGTDLARLARANGAAAVVLDPGSPAELALTQAEFHQIADARMPIPLGSGTSSLSHASRRIRPTRAAWPAEALAAIKRIGERPEVEACYLFDVAYDDGDPVPAVGLRFMNKDPGIVDRIMGELAGELSSLLPRAAAADLIVVDDNLLAGLRGRISPLTGQGTQ
jgi:SseB protein N-terminal domain